MKKTIRLDKMKVRINQQLAEPAISDETKETLCRLLESVLHEADAYQGYNDIYWMTTGHGLWIKAGQPEDTTKDQFIYGPTGQKYARRYY